MIRSSIIGVADFWRRDLVPVFYERFLLGVLTALFVANLLTNPMGFNSVQRSGVGVILLGCALLVGGTVQRLNESPPPPSPPVDPPGPARPLPPEEKKADEAPNAPEPEKSEAARAKPVPPSPRQEKPKPAPPIEGNPQSAPKMKPMIEGLSVSTPRQVNSDRDDLPYAVELTIQSRGDVSPFAFTVRTNRPLHRGTFRVINQFLMLAKYETNYTDGPHPFYNFGTSSPAITPRTPLVVTLYAKEPFAVIAVDRVPYESFVK